MNSGALHVQFYLIR